MIRRSRLAGRALAASMMLSLAGGASVAWAAEGEAKGSEAGAAEADSTAAPESRPAPGPASAAPESAPGVATPPAAAEGSASGSPETAPVSAPAVGAKKKKKSRFVPTKLRDEDMPLTSTEATPRKGSKSLLTRWWFIGGVAVLVGGLFVTSIVLSSQPLRTGTEGLELGIISLRPVKK